jgi:16S rRNA (guanine966-N2)-methyltransferase
MSVVRITGGTLRGRRVTVPRDGVRPTSERARQAYFNILGDRIEGARFLDLFTGTGIFAFEAMSRGAASVVAIDLSRKQLAEITQQARGWHVTIDTVAGDAIAVAPRAKGPFDLVYADPPYDYDRHDDLLRMIDSLDLSREAVVALEHRRRTEPWTYEPRKLVKLRRAEYGEVWITFYGRLGAANATSLASSDSGADGAPNDND